MDHSVDVPSSHDHLPLRNEPPCVEIADPDCLQPCPALSKLELPPELLDMIAALCSVEALRSCILASKALATIVQRYLFHSVSITCASGGDAADRFIACLHDSLFASRNIRRLTLRKPGLARNASIPVATFRKILSMLPDLEHMTIRDVAVRHADKEPCTAEFHHIDNLCLIGAETAFPNDVLPALVSFARINTLVLDIAVARYNDNEQLFPTNPPPAFPSIKLERPCQLDVQHIRTRLDVLPLFRPTMFSLVNLQSATIATEGMFWLGLPVALLWTGVFLSSVGPQLKALHLDLNRVLLDFLFSTAPMHDQQMDRMSSQLLQGISLCTNLHYFGLCGVTTYPADDIAATTDGEACRFIASIVEHVPPSQLAHLVFDISTASADTNRVNVDLLSLALARFPHMKSVAMKALDGASALEMLNAQCRERGRRDVQIFPDVRTCTAC